MFFGLEVTANSLYSNDTLAIYLNKSIESKNNDHIQESIQYLQKARRYCRTKEEEAKVLNSLGRRYFTLSDYHTAIRYYDSSITLISNIDLPNFEGYICNNYGLAYTHLFNFEKAIEYYTIAISKVDKRSMGVVHFNIGKCYSYSQEPDSAKKHFSIAYELNRKIFGDDKFNTLAAGLELAELKGQVSPDLKGKVLKSNSNHLKGIYYSLEGNYEIAEKYFNGDYNKLLKLHTKFEQWQKAVTAIDSVRNSVESIDSKLFLQANERMIYKNAIDEMLKIDKDSAFSVALKSHSNILKEGLDFTLDKFPESYNYYDFDSVIYLFVNTGSLKFYRIIADSTFQDYYNKFLSTFDLYWIKSRFMENFRVYTESGYYLYKKLLPEISKEMLIIPEGRLQYIPFEALLTEFPDTTEYPYYKCFPYLLHKADIRYDYILREYSKTKGMKSITAFAPDLSLDYAIKEVESLWPFRSKRLVGEDATLTNICSGEILHIATHYDPREYCLKFSDSILEINKLGKLPKDLVVLSTCYSGYGKRHIGEGTFSASRAFYLAGSETVIESLWTNTDKSSYMIFSSFYQELYKGTSRGTSLNIAKRKYLEDCLHYLSHPYFWANIRMFGNGQSLNLKSNFAILYWLFGGIISIVLVKNIFRFGRK